MAQIQRVVYRSKVVYSELYINLLCLCLMLQIFMLYLYMKNENEEKNKQNSNSFSVLFHTVTGFFVFQFSWFVGL